jgi:hypothetical protein
LNYNYKLETVKLKNHIDLKMPTDWNQLTRRQLLFVCRLFRLKLSEFNFKLSIFIRFTGIRALPVRKVSGQTYYAFKKSGQVFWISIDELYFFIGAANYLCADSQLTKNLFPKFTLLGRRFFGPSAKCYNITLLEFLHAEATLFRFHTSHNPKQLATLCAILYRPQVKGYNPNSPDYKGDRREPFNDYTFQRRVWWFKLLHPNRQYAVYVFYAGCRRAIMEAHPEVFGGGGAVSSEPVNPVDSIKSLITILTNGNVTEREKIENTRVWAAFGQLNDMAVANRETMKQIKKRK